VPRWFRPSPASDQIYDILTSDRIATLSRGRIRRMTPVQASALMGCWIVETGSPALDRLDVIERANGQKGRGLGQYTGPRRVAYDRAIHRARSQGHRIDSPAWQLSYFAQEYLGLHDPAPGRSLIGWTRTFERFRASSIPDAVHYLTRTYFRPSVPHMDRRIQAAMEVHHHYTAVRGRHATVPVYRA
jgi:hypothetical protein